MLNCVLVMVDLMVVLKYPHDASCVFLEMKNL
jgi:hypothetical protein